MAEPESAIGKSHDASPGLDNVHYLLIEHFSAASLHSPGSFY